MDALDQFLSDHLLCKENILKYVDDYSLYSYYIGEELELNTKYSSPLRQGDDDPSFSIYYSKYKDIIMFKDSASGKFGDVFAFISELGSISLRNALLQVNSDFKLGFAGDDVGEFKPKLIKSRPVRKEPVVIEITYKEPNQEFQDYWNYLEVTPETLQLYFVTNPYLIHYITGEKRVVFYPRNLTIAYEILGTYKIYNPFENKKFKFRNNFPGNYVEGALQLKFKKSFAIITKSSKECIFMYQHFDWETVAGTSENTIINKHFMLKVLHVKYTKVFIWLDNDVAGILAQEKYLQLYPWLIPIKVDDYIKQKDPTDLFTEAKKKGKKNLALKYMKQLIENKI